MGNTAVMEKAGARIPEDLSSVHNDTWELRHVMKVLCFNLENRSEKSDRMDKWEAPDTCVSTVLLSGVLGATRHKGRPGPVGPAVLSFYYPRWMAAICVSACTPWEEPDRLQPELRN